MLTGIHFLLTYACTYECDHCFLYCSPFSQGTFTTRQIREILTDAKHNTDISGVYFEGGEPFLFYAAMLEGTRIAKELGLKVGYVTNAYWAVSVEDAELYLKPLFELGIDNLFFSDDQFHYSSEDNFAKNAMRAAEELGFPAHSICIEKPVVTEVKNADGTKGQAIIGGGARFRGRAADKLIEDLPRRDKSEFAECPDEDFADPSRVHIDPFGNVMLCQGINMGRITPENPFSKIVRDYDPEEHPIVRPLMKGGPGLLAKAYGIEVGDNFVDACHYCFEVRKKLMAKYPDILCPNQVYGLE